MGNIYNMAYKPKRMRVQLSQEFLQKKTLYTYKSAQNREWKIYYNLASKPKRMTV